MSDLTNEERCSYAWASSRLGVDPAAGEVEIKRAYRKAAMLHHPDLGGSDLVFGEIVRAYQILVGRRPDPIVGPSIADALFRESAKTESEAKFQGRLIKALRGSGAVVLKVHANLYTGSGWPDLNVTHPRWSGWLELKVGSHKAEPHQIRVMEDLRAAGARVWVVRAVEKQMFVEEPDGGRVAEVRQVGELIPVLVNL